MPDSPLTQRELREHDRLGARRAAIKAAVALHERRGGLNPAVYRPL